MLAFALGRANAAQAAGVCSPNGTHYYGEACQFGSSFLGVQDDIQSDVLTVADSQHDLVINDLWIVDPNANPVQFIEAGMFFGHICTDQDPVSFACHSGFTAGANDRFLWADQRPGSDYYAHIDTNDIPSHYTPYHDKIWREDSTDWGVSVGPYINQTSTNNSMDAELIRTGTEQLPQTGVTACDGQNNLQYQDAAGHWSTSWWDASNTNAQLEQDSPPYAKWLNTNVQLRDWTGDSYSQCWGSSAAASTATSPSTSSPASAAGAALTAAQVTQIAEGFATAMNDSFPTTIEHVASTRHQAVFALSADDVPGPGSVYAIVMRGQFIDENAPRPPEASAPTGPVLTMVIDAGTGELTDFGIGNQVPDLSGLGTVTVDH